MEFERGKPGKALSMPASMDSGAIPQSSLSLLRTSALYRTFVFAPPPAFSTATLPAISPVAPVSANHAGEGGDSSNCDRRAGAWAGGRGLVSAANEDYTTVLRNGVCCLTHQSHLLSEIAVLRRHLAPATATVAACVCSTEADAPIAFNGNCKRVFCAQFGNSLE